MANVYNTIKKLCDENEISISSLCDNVGIGRSTITELKAGRTKTLSSETLSKIADYFHVNIDYLYTGDDQSLSKNIRVIKKLIEVTNASQLKWNQIEWSPLSKSFQVTNSSMALYDFDLLSYPEYVGYVVDNNKSYFSNYKDGGYLFATLKDSISGKNTNALFIYYRNHFCIISDENCAQLLTALSKAIYIQAMGINKFLDEFLNDSKIAEPF